MKHFDIYITIPGHSLGAAVATLDGVMLKMALPSNVAVDAVVFGLPRVGNQEFATMVDQLVRFSRSFISITFSNDLFRD